MIRPQLRNCRDTKKKYLEGLILYLVCCFWSLTRCKMWLWLGLNPEPWCPQQSHVLTTKWKIQKQLLSRCLDLLLAAVYLDQGFDAALGVAEVLLQGTPPTGMDKAWIPSWANKGAAAAAASGGGLGGHVMRGPSFGGSASTSQLTAR